MISIRCCDTKVLLKVISSMAADMVLAMHEDTHTYRTNMDTMMCLTMPNLQAESIGNMYAVYQTSVNDGSNTDHGDPGVCAVPGTASNSN